MIFVIHSQSNLYMEVALFFLALVIFRLTYIIIRSVDMGKAIAALIKGQAVPVYFEWTPKRMPNHYEQFLYRNEKYYRELPPKRRKSYASRIMKFMDDKKFETREGLVLTKEMLIMISSAAIKISFGLREYMFSSFHTIIIYPDEFYSRTFKLKLKGQTNARGVIVFSWKDLEFGNAIADDSINLGYHEFAHALFLEHFLQPYEGEFKDHYREWLMFIKNNSSLNKVRQEHIFRNYATTNEMEFFAVALENFFEKPIHFKQELPQLYAHMRILLNQDTASGRYNATIN